MIHNEPELPVATANQREQQLLWIAEKLTDLNLKRFCKREGEL
tara:strand:+ start:281 stop:409 length:129 start_codon:yes stop_codon:yes gene_type:complete